MKRIAILFTAIMLVTFAVPVFALDFGGFAEKVFQGGIETLVSVTVAGIFAILGLFVKKAITWKRAATEGVQVVMALYKSRLPNSPGGQKITEEELAKLITETKEFGVAFAKAWEEARGRPLAST